MKLYYAPGACSLASHVALEETGISYEPVKVDLKSHTIEDGADFYGVNRKGYVPALAIDEADVLTENIAVLSYIGDRAGDLMPASGMRRWRALEALAFVSTELHKGFKPFFNPDASDAEKDAARKQLGKRFALAAEMLEGRDFLLGDELSVADCYLFVMLFWARGKGIELTGGLPEYYERLKARPAFARALEAEGVMEKA